jgi:hypothetical protein
MLAAVAAALVVMQEMVGQVELQVLTPALLMLDVLLLPPDHLVVEVVAAVAVVGVIVIINLYPTDMDLAAELD